MASSLVLVGDIGGTNSRLQAYEISPDDKHTTGCAPGKIIKEQQFLNGDFKAFDDVLRAFLAGLTPPSAACLAVAGPVERNAVSFTNRDWVIDGGALERRFGIGKVRLVNDFVANGYGLLTLDEAKECVTLQAAPKVAGAPMACVGAGTGLGECFSTASAEGSPYETFASEGGHSDWAPRTALEVELLGFLKDRFGQKHRVSVERVISGPGLATMYDFFSARFPDKVVAEVHAAVGAAGELKGKVIAQHSAPGAAPFCELCRLTMETFATAFGAEAASAALKWVPLGGLYIAGGMTPKNLRLLEGADSLFMRAFGDKGRLSPLLKRVPVYAVLAEDIGQRGAHLVAFRMLRASAPSATPSDIPAVQRFFHRLMLRSLPLSPPLAARSVVLVGDVGGTNTRLQLYAVEEGARVMDQQRAPGKLIHSAQYLNGDFGSFHQIVSTFLADQPSPSLAPPPPSAACLAVAGPVERNAVSFTNRDWVIDGGALERRFGIGKVRLVNDFVANGYGLLTLDEAKECVTLQAAPKVAGAPMACVGAGTGLGECFSTASAEGSPYETFASEGGHSDWAPRTALEVELLGFLKDRFGQKHRVSVERVISGPGLATMYDFFSARFPDKVVAEVHAAVGAAGELKGKVIAQHSAPGAAPFCELCRLTMETFATAFGAEAASAALKWVPLGGLYIAGGMTPKNLRLLEGADSLFMRAFGDKGRLSPLLKRVPVYAVLAEDIGQRGAHLVAFRMLLTMQEEQEEVLRAPDAKEAQASLPPLAEFNAIKHSLSWRGSYPRKLVISPNEIITKDPSGNITNRWSKDEFTAAAAIEEENEDAARFVIKLLSSGLLCGMGSTDLTFSALDKEQRSVILKTLESLAVA